MQTEPLDHRAVIEILHQHGRPRAVEQGSQYQAQDRARDASFRRVVGEQGSKASHRIEASDRQPNGCQRADDSCWQGDVMGEIGPQITIELAHLAHDPKQITRIKAAAPPSDAMQLKPFGLDCRTMAINASCDVHLEARIACRARHRKPMRDEVPVLGYEIDYAWGRGARFGYRRADSHRGREHVRELRDRADDVIETSGACRLD